MTTPTADDERRAGALLDLAQQIDAQRAALPGAWPGISALHASVHNRLQNAADELRRAAGELRTGE